MSSSRPRLQCNVLDERLHDYLPTYATAGSAGMDLRALLDAPLTLAPGECQLVRTGSEVKSQRIPAWAAVRATFFP